MVRHLDTNLDGTIDKSELNEEEINEAIQKGIAGWGAFRDVGYRHLMLLLQVRQCRAVWKPTPMCHEKDGKRQ